jgi:hypothetical protein
MKVKVCPKCGAENKPDRASCSGCYSSLEDVAETEAKPRPAAAPSQPQEPRPPAGASPLSGPATAEQQTPAGYFAPLPDPPRPYVPEFNQRRLSSVSRGPNWGAIALVIVLLAGVAYGGWWAYNKYLKPGPDKVVQQFLDAAKAGDYDKLEACLTQSMVNIIQAVPGGGAAAKQSLLDQIRQQMEGKVTGVTYDEKNNSLAYVALEPTSKSHLPPGVTSIDVVCSKENNQWKVDLIATTMRMTSKMPGSRGTPGMPRP